MLQEYKSAMSTTDFSTWGGCLKALFLALLLSNVIIADHSSLPIVYKDVAIIGGGASGTYAAVRLREDFGRSVLLIEQEAFLVSISTNSRDKKMADDTVNREVTSTPIPIPRPVKHSIMEFSHILITRVPELSSSDLTFLYNLMSYFFPTPSLLIQALANLFRMSRDHQSTPQQLMRFRGTTIFLCRGIAFCFRDTGTSRLETRFQSTYYFPSTLSSQNMIWGPWHPFF